MSIGRWSIHHPRAAVAAWLAFVAVCVALGAISGTKTPDAAPPASPLAAT